MLHRNLRKLARLGSGDCTDRAAWEACVCSPCGVWGKQQPT